MQIEEMIPRLMIVKVTALVVALVPNGLKLTEGLWPAAVHFLNQVAVHLFAVAHPPRLYLQSLIKQVIFTGDDIYEVTDTLRCVRSAVQVDVTAASRTFGERPRTVACG